MPTVQNTLPNDSEQITTYKTATHDSGPQTAPLDAAEAENDKQTAFASGEPVRRVQGRYAISSAGVAPALRASAWWVIAYTLFLALSLTGQSVRGKALTPSLIMGEVLDKLVWGIVGFHIVSFKGRTNRAWAVSWLFRFTMFFASSSVYHMGRYGSWNRSSGWAMAFLLSTGSIMWQYIKQAKADKKLEV